MKTPKIFDQNGNLTTSNDTSISIDNIIDEFVATKRSENTKRAYAKDLSDMFEYIGITELHELGIVQFHTLVTKLHEYLESKSIYDEETKRIVNPKTVNRKAYSISSFFKFLIHTYEYPKNPLGNYQSHKTQQRSNTPSLTGADVIDVISYFEEHHRKSQTKFRNYLAICCLAVLALRRNELVGLKWSDIDFEENSVNVYQKGGTYKLLPVAPKLLKRIAEYRDKYSHGPYVFAAVNKHANKSLKKPLTTQYIYQIVVETVFKVTNGKRATPHSFRKSFIEIALNNGEDFISIMNATGHSTVEMVKYYDGRDTLKNNAAHGMAKFI
jgi:integrase/recombinase XerC